MSTPGPESVAELMVCALAGQFIMFLATGFEVNKASVGLGAIVGLVGFVALQMVKPSDDPKVL